MILSETQAAERPADRLPGIGSTNGMSLAARAHRTASVVKWVSLVLIVIALFVVIRALPADRAIDVLKVKVDGLGIWGPIVLGAAYIFAALAFFPGSARIVDFRFLISDSGWVTEWSIVDRHRLLVVISTRDAGFRWRWPPTHR